MRKKAPAKPAIITMIRISTKKTGNFFPLGGGSDAEVTKDAGGGDGGGVGVKDGLGTGGASGAPGGIDGSGGGVTGGGGLIGGSGRGGLGVSGCG